MLYAPELHEPLTDRAWDEVWVRDAIARIVADAVNAYDPDTFWPVNESDGEDLPLPLTDVYSGASGVVWALDQLGAALDVRAAGARALERYCDLPDVLASLPLPEQRNSSLLAGKTGVVFVAWRVDADETCAERLLELVRANVGNKANELLWGVPERSSSRARCSPEPATSAGATRLQRAKPTSLAHATPTASGLSTCTGT